MLSGCVAAPAEGIKQWVSGEKPKLSQISIFLLEIWHRPWKPNSPGRNRAGFFISHLVCLFGACKHDRNENNAKKSQQKNYSLIALRKLRNQALLRPGQFCGNFFGENPISLSQFLTELWFLEGAKAGFSGNDEKQKHNLLKLWNFFTKTLKTLKKPKIFVFQPNFNLATLIGHVEEESYAHCFCSKFNRVAYFSGKGVGNGSIYEKWISSLSFQWISLFWDIFTFYDSIL